MPAWLPFQDYARLKRMEPGSTQLLRFPNEPMPRIRRHANRLRSLLAHRFEEAEGERMYYHWSVRLVGRDILVEKGSPWKPLQVETTGEQNGRADERHA